MYATARRPDSGNAGGCARPWLGRPQTLYDFAERHGIEFPDGAVIDPADLVRLALDGLERGVIEILDPSAVEAKASLAGPPRSFAL